MKAIQITVNLPDATSDAEREAIANAMISGIPDGIQFTLAGASSVRAQARDAEQARRYRAIKLALSEPD